MKKTGFLATITVALGMSLFMVSCGSGADKTTTEPAADSSATATTDTSAPKPPEMAVAEFKPYKALIIQHKVANFAKWKLGYESHDSIRHSYGLTGYVLGRGLNDSNTVIIILKMDDVNKAKELTGSRGMMERMQKAGVIGKPSFGYMDVVMDDDSPIETTARLMVSNKVKDWDAWKKEFDDHKQARTDAGLKDRALSYSDGDNHQVQIVFAVTDMAKANAFLNSKDLKDKMAKAGVEGAPVFFFYNIVQKY